MKVKQHVSGLLVMAGVVFVSACDNSDRVAAPTAAGNLSTASHDASTAVITPAPIVSGVPLPNVCLDIKGGTASAPAAGAPMQAWQCHGGANQQLVLQTNGTITGYGGQLCLDVWHAMANDGDPVVAWVCNGGANQKWTYTAAGQLQTAVNGKCLDLWQAQGQNGAQIVVWPCHGGSNQKWTVKAVASTALVGPITPILPVAPAAPTATATATAVGSAELPRTYLNTAAPAVTGRTINVAANGDLQAALNAAQPGDEVVLPSGATYVGNFVLPTKAGMSGTQWITVRSGGSIPAEGTRVGPANAGQMPKILTPNAMSALATVPGAQGWRLIGLEVGATPAAPLVYSLLAFGTAGTDQQTAAQVPSRLVLDRSYVHGAATLTTSRCLMLNSASSAVVDSYLAECHTKGGDSQAIMGWNGPGPYKIVDNYLEGAGEVIMFGGADPTVANNVPSDIEIRRNHITRPTAWKGVWSVKNLLELKMGQRVLVEANVFENNWVDAQAGAAVVMNSNNQDGTCTWCITSDVTFRSNVVRNTPDGIAFADHGSNGGVNPSQAMRRVTITNNLVLGVDAAGGTMFQITGTIDGLTIVGNTAVGGGVDATFTTSALPAQTTFVYRNNVTGGIYPLGTGDGAGAGTQAMAALRIPAANVAGNVFLNTTFGYLVPPGNVYGPASGAGFANYAAGDLTLTAASPYRAAGVGGATPGADLAALATATSGVKLQ